MLPGKSNLAGKAILAVLLVVGCASVDYVGRSLDPTVQVDVYYSAEEIERKYTVIGHAIGTGKFLVSNEAILEELIEEARSRGADAILITGIDKSHVPTDDGSVEEKQIIASFLKYE